jgi:LacI family transcriptional regulator, galactose operon repressor
MAAFRRQVSQKLIAQRAGVSQATVSLVLSGRGVSSDETQRRVLAAAEQLKYRPNLLVQGMQTGKTRMIGVMAPPFDYYWSEILYGIHDVLAAADHVPITLWTAHEGSGPRPRNGINITELDQIHRLLDRRVDGVILWPPFASLFQDHVHEFSSRNLPVVTIDHELPPEFKADSVGSDESAGGRMVAEHLLALGHRRIGHLAGPAVATWAIARRESFERALRDSGQASGITLEAPKGDIVYGLKQAREMINLPDRPTAVFAASDLYAKCVYRAASEAGLRIPDDLSVVGFSDDGFAQEMDPPLTTVRQLAYEIGRNAADLILARSSGKIGREQIQRVRLPVELIVRQSTATMAGNRKSSKASRAELQRLG